MPATSDQRALATALAVRSDAELAELFAARGIPPTAGWRDLFDAAEGMLEPGPLSRALAVLPAASAHALADAVADGLAVDPDSWLDLSARALTTPRGEVYAAVADAVRALPTLDRVDASAPQPVQATTPAEDAAASERAFTGTASLADVLLSALDTPLGRIGTGGLGAVDRRRLVEAGAVADPAAADLLVGLGEAVGLLAVQEKMWLVTRAGRDWLYDSTVDRWREVAVRLRDALPPGIRSAAGGWVPATTWADAHPFDPAWPARSEQWRARAVAWGLFTPEGKEPPWAVPLARGEAEPDLQALRGMLPPEVDRVYLQNDLTAIAPGPLAPHLDVRLRRAALRESRAQASTYRFTADTIAAAIGAGETAESLRAFLTGLSLTGLPQPLGYMIDRTAARHGLLRVATEPTTGRTRVTSEDRSAIETLAVDQALRPLGLSREDGGLVSRVPEEAVFWALADARYPVVAVDTNGAPRMIERGRIARESTHATPLESYAGLIERLRADEGGDDDAAWLERELDQAVRARAVVDVIVRLPDGSTRPFRLEATGLGGGRLRGRDRNADVERTVPLTSVVSVHPVP